MHGAVASRVAPAPSRSFFTAAKSRRSLARSGTGRSTLPALCIASLTNGTAGAAHSNGNGAAKGFAAVDLEAFSIKDQRGLCLSPLGQEAVAKEIKRQKQSANKQPQKVLLLDLDMVSRLMTPPRSDPLAWSSWR